MVYLLFLLGVTTAAVNRGVSYCDVATSFYAGGWFVCSIAAAACNRRFGASRATEYRLSTFVMLISFCTLAVVNKFTAKPAAGSRRPASAKPWTLVAILKTTPSYLNICMTRLLLILLTVIGLNISNSFACDCSYNGPFLKMAKRTPFVALVKVTKYLTFKDIYNSMTPMSMEIEIIDIYKGKENRKTVTVWGDIGNLCRPYLSTFKEGQYYVIALDNGNYGGGHPNEKDTDYSICGCGCYWMAVDFEKLIVKGDIESKDMKSTTLKLSELKVKLTQNGY